MDSNARLCYGLCEDNLGNSQSRPSIVTLSTATKWSYQGLINRYCGQLNLCVLRERNDRQTLRVDSSSTAMGWSELGLILDKPRDAK
jgi:hypothetical protein